MASTSENTYKVWMCSPGVWKLTAGANLYLLEIDDDRILIDAGSRAERKELTTWLSKICPFDRINKIILTHAHYDHSGNFDLFPNAEIFIAPEEIASLHDNPEDATLQEGLGEKLLSADLKSVQDFDVPSVEIVRTPGHTPGSICVWIPDRRILFSGDTLFVHSPGRCDLPTSNAEQMQNSLMSLVPYNFKFLCPGHDEDPNLPLPH